MSHAFCLFKGARGLSCSSLCVWGWPWTSDPLVFVSQGRELQVDTICGVFSFLFIAFWDSSVLSTTWMKCQWLFSLSPLCYPALSSLITLAGNTAQLPGKRNSKGEERRNFWVTQQYLSKQCFQLQFMTLYSCEINSRVLKSSIY